MIRFKSGNYKKIAANQEHTNANKIDISRFKSATINNNNICSTTANTNNPTWYVDDNPFAMCMNALRE